MDYVAGGIRKDERSKVQMTDCSFIRFERSGGFTGLTITLDQKSLLPEVADQIRIMMEESGLSAMPVGRKPERPVPDEFTYTLVFMTEEVEHTLVFAESKMPATLRPLIRYLSREARRETQE